MASIRKSMAKKISYKTQGRFRRKEKQVYHKKGAVSTRKPRGSGHRAGEGWGEAKQIDPESAERKYSKNSPSFDQGVRNYKAKAHNKAVSTGRLDRYLGK